MGVWQHSPAGIGIALTNDDLRISFDAALPDWQPTMLWDLPTASAAMLSMIILVDEARSPAPGRPSRRGGMGLILDFVPNHVAPDHPRPRASRSCQYAAELAKTSSMVTS
jgi:hypothetical protein